MTANCLLPTAYCLLLPPFPLPLSRIAMRLIKIRMLVLQPLHELLDLFILQQPLDGVVISFQLTLGKNRMDLIMTNAMKIDRLFSFKSFRNKMMLVKNATQRALA